ncbi:MAG: DUF2157 domain-containing protein [Lachnospiraceae bacterium]|nr:DUF2157 domain-containing protein [Lachnospiraceae bacterium]
MRKKDNKPEHIFETVTMAMEINAGKKAEALKAINNAAYNTRMPVLHSKKQILKNHFLYMDKIVPGFQILLYTIMAISVMCLYKEGLGKQEVIIAAMLLSGIMGMISIIEICRMFFSDLAELGESCYFNIYQMTALHMVYSGIINLTALLSGILFVGGKWKTDLLQTGLYILVPFVFAECGCLTVLLTRAGRRNPYIACTAGIFTTLFFGILATMPQVYHVSASVFWGGAFILGILLLGMQIKKLFVEIEKGDILCTN